MTEQKCSEGPDGLTTGHQLDSTLPVTSHMAAETLIRYQVENSFSVG